MLQKNVFRMVVVVSGFLEANFVNEGISVCSTQRALRIYSISSFAACIADSQTQEHLHRTLSAIGET